MHGNALKIYENFHFQILKMRSLGMHAKSPFYEFWRFDLAWNPSKIPLPLEFGRILKVESLRNVQNPVFEFVEGLPCITCKVSVQVLVLKKRFCSSASSGKRFCSSANSEKVFLRPQNLRRKFQRDRLAARFEGVRVESEEKLENECFWKNVRRLRNYEVQPAHEIWEFVRRNLSFWKWVSEFWREIMENMFENMENMFIWTDQIWSLQKCDSRTWQVLCVLR